MSTRWNALSGPTHALLRIMAGFLFMLHGGQKHFGWFGGMDGQGGTVELASLMGLAGALEVVGGALIMIGLFTRPVAFIVAGEMAIAYFIAHLPQAFWPIQNQGEPAVLFCFIFLFLAFNGAGPWSVDAARGGDVAAQEAAPDKAERERRIA